MTNVSTPLRTGDSPLVFGQRASIWDRLVAASGAKPGDQVLDLGCGTGYFARRLAPVVGLSGAVLGVDPLQPPLDYAAAHSPLTAHCAPRTPRTSLSATNRLT